MMCMFLNCRIEYLAFLLFGVKEKTGRAACPEKKDRSACVRKMEIYMETTPFLILGKEKALADEPPTLRMILDSTIIAQII